MAEADTLVFSLGTAVDELKRHAVNAKAALASGDTAGAIEHMERVRLLCHLDGLVDDAIAALKAVPTDESEDR